VNEVELLGFRSLTSTLFLAQTLAMGWPLPRANAVVKRTGQRSTLSAAKG